MTPDQKAAFINSQVACAQIDMAAMAAENEANRCDGRPIAWGSNSFIALIDKYAIGHNAVITFMED